MHPTTYEYLKPTDEQVNAMARVRAAAKAYNDILDAVLPDGPDKTFVIRAHRSNAMWANVAITRQPDGTPRTLNQRRRNATSRLASCIHAGGSRVSDIRNDGFHIYEVVLAENHKLRAALEEILATTGEDKSCCRGIAARALTAIEMKEQIMSYSGPSMEGFELLQRLARPDANGISLPKRDSVADSLAKDRLIECRRSDNDTETWWITDKGRDFCRSAMS